MGRERRLLFEDGWAILEDGEGGLFVGRAWRGRALFTDAYEWVGERLLHEELVPAARPGSDVGIRIDD